MKGNISRVLALVGVQAAALALAYSNNRAEYDYIVIGSGPGGGPLAANLARAGHSVLILEAGGNRGDELLQQIPRWGNLNSEHPEMSWQFFVSHSKNETQARRDRAFSYRLANGTLWSGTSPPPGATPLGIFYPRGATVGGSAIANAMNVILPPDNFWNDIADTIGDDSWSSDNMRQHFIALEKNAYAPEGAPGHGFDGYISTNLNNASFLVDRAGVLEILQNAISLTEGVERPEYDEVVGLMQRDVNRPDSDRYELPTVFQTPVHITEQRRRSSPWEIITDTLSERLKNGSYPLTLSTHSLATKILFDNGSEAPRAYGVEYLKGEGLYEADRRYNASVSGQKRVAFARKEVIVAGGAFNTPQILKLSGIGPREELEKHGIPVVAELPAVGEYLQDNYEIGIHVNSHVPFENDPFQGCSFDPNGTAQSDPCLSQWLQGYGGYGDGAAPIFMIHRTEFSDNNNTDLIIFGGAGNVFNGHYPGYSKIPWPATSFFFAVVGMQYHNPTGTVKLRSPNPRESPEISFNFYEKGAETDIPALQKGLEHAVNIVNATGEPYQPFEWIDPPADRSLEQHIRDHSWSHHALGSCRIGASAEDSCVDSNFKVHGVTGLRVVDGSIFPTTPGGFPVGATFVIGQKALGNILGDARN